MMGDKATAVEEGKMVKDLDALLRPDSFGRFGQFGGKYVPETLMYALTELESALRSVANDPQFQVLLFLISCLFFGFSRKFCVFLLAP